MIVRRQFVSSLMLNNVCRHMLFSIRLVLLHATSKANYPQRRVAILQSSVAIWSKAITQNPLRIVIVIAITNAIDIDIPFPIASGIHVCPTDLASAFALLSHIQFNSHVHILLSVSLVIAYCVDDITCFLHSIIVQ